MIEFEPLTPQEAHLNEWVRHMVDLYGVEFLYHVLSKGVNSEGIEEFLTPEQKMELDKRYQAAHQALLDHYTGVHIDIEWKSKEEMLATLPESLSSESQEAYPSNSDSLPNLQDHS